MSIKCPITNIDLRNSVRYPDVYISRCGRIYHNTKRAHKFVILTRTEKYPYLAVACDDTTSSGMNLVHILVGHAWVYNPCPGVFNMIDHMDRDSQNNDASNLRWVTNQLNCLNKKLKGWEKVVNKAGAVYYRSVTKINGKRHVTYCRSKEEAIETSKRRQREFFDSIYQKHVDDFESVGAVNERLAHHVLWSDEPVETPEGFTRGNTELRRYTEGRHAQFMF